MGLFQIDPKPIGAFIEYTLKPLIDDARELIDALESHNLKLGDVIRVAYRIYILDSFLRLVTTVACTGLICYTALRFLHTN